MPSQGLVATALVTEEVVLATAAASMPNTTVSGAARLADQAHSDWVLPHDGFACAEMVKRACGAAGFQPNVVGHATDFSVQPQLVAAGIGVALVPRLAARGLPEGLQLLPVHPAVNRRHFALARRSARSDAGIRRIVEILKQNALRVLDQSPPRMATPSSKEGT